MTIQIQNEVVNYLNSGARVDFFYVKGTALESVIEMIDSPLPAITDIKIKVLYQNEGDVIKEYTINQAPSNQFTWSIAVADFANNKALNYWVEAVDQDDHLLFYGSFTIN